MSIPAFHCLIHISYLKLKDDLSSYGTSKLQTLINFNGKQQSATFEGETNLSTPDIDGDDTNAEWKLFRRVLFKQFKNLN